MCLNDGDQLCNSKVLFIFIDKVFPVLNVLNLYSEFQQKWFFDTVVQEYTLPIFLALLMIEQHLIKMCFVEFDVSQKYLNFSRNDSLIRFCWGTHCPWLIVVCWRLNNSWITCALLNSMSQSKILEHRFSDNWHFPFFKVTFSSTMLKYPIHDR